MNAAMDTPTVIHVARFTDVDNPTLPTINAPTTTITGMALT